MTQQPWLHELEIAVNGPSTALSAHDGQISRPGTGWFVDDRRVVSVLQVRCDEEPATAVAFDTVGTALAVLDRRPTPGGPHPRPHRRGAPDAHADRGRGG